LFSLAESKSRPTKERDVEDEREDLEKQTKAKEAVQTKVEELRKKLLQTKVKRPLSLDEDHGEDELGRNHQDGPVSK
jgi:hypothetical protein